MKKHCITRATRDDLLSVFTWSLRCLATGIFPSRRHDDRDWMPVDQKRQRLSAKQMPLRGILTEIRGDWACVKEVFRLPGWRDAAGCCWRCSATNVTMRFCGTDAPWRQERRDLWDMHLRWREQGLQPSPVMGSPFFQTRVFQIDWLHCMDIGVACDF